jgi:MFS family permease
VPLSNILGRRPVLLVSTLLMTLCTMWCGLATGYNSLMAARIVQGIGGAAADTVAPALVRDVFFMHERGRAMTIYTVFLVLGPLVCGVTWGYIGSGPGWANVFWVGVALSAAVFLEVALLVLETLYDREASLRDTLAHTPHTAGAPWALAQSTPGVCITSCSRGAHSHFLGRGW